jgi:hypothetical protein
MRAATVFTGAAGLAVAFGPAAMAAAGQAPAHGHSARATGTTPAHIQLTAADIKSKGCTTNTWLHIEYTSPFRDLCKQFGYTGSVVFGSLTMIAQCGGNNYGDLFIAAHSPITFGPGKTYRNLTYLLNGVSITHWKGTDECAWPR